jgi:exopolysaccharide biosynthesis polyprenyl glycosylphosphotransferase
VRRMTSGMGSSRPLHLLGDVAVALGTFYLAFLIRTAVNLPFTRALLPGDRIDLFATDWGLVVASQLLLLYLFSFYDPPRPRAWPELARGLTVVVTLQGLILAGFYFLVNRVFPRSVLVLFVALELPALVLWRWLNSRLQRVVRRRIAIVGTGPAARELARTIDEHHYHGLRVAGFVPAPDETSSEESEETDSDDDSGPGLEAPGPILGTVDELPALLAAGEIDDVILVTGRREWRSRLLDRLSVTRPAHSSVLLLPGPFDSLIGRMRYRWVHDLPVIEVMGEAEWHQRLPWKRALDLAVGGLLLLLALPVMGVVAMLVEGTSAGPVLYRQVRIGRDQRSFLLFKFRTMREGAEAGGNEVLAQPGDPRLTPVGAFLRRFRLDELPQLFNVLAGTMSLVGPRPERPGFVATYLREIPGYAERFSLRPGLTGLAQINGEYHSSARNKLRYDLAYLANRSLLLDLSILFRTVKIVLTSRGT